jgi:hypothetical protein
MLNKLFVFVQRHASLLGRCLIFLIFANFVVQFVTHKTTALTPWKGGGFGMYTEPHFSNRSVWLTMQTPDEVRHVLLYPHTVNADEVVRADSVRDFNALRKAAWEFRIFPTDKKAQMFLESAQTISWQPEFIAQEDVQIVVFENRSDLSAKTLRRVPIFTSSDGGA